MTKRPRTSTIVLTVLFLAVLRAVFRGAPHTCCDGNDAPAGLQPDPGAQPHAACSQSHPVIQPVSQPASEPHAEHAVQFGHAQRVALPGDIWHT